MVPYNSSGSTGNMKSMRDVSLNLTGVSIAGSRDLVRGMSLGLSVVYSEGTRGWGTIWGSSGVCWQQQWMAGRHGLERPRSQKASTLFLWVLGLAPCTVLNHLSLLYRALHEFVFWSQSCTARSSWVHEAFMHCASLGECSLGIYVPTGERHMNLYSSSILKRTLLASF